DNITVINNLIYNDAAGGIVVAIDACGVGPSNVTVANNTVIGSYRYGLNIHDLTGALTVKNNIFYALPGSPQGGQVEYATASDMASTISDNNLYVSGND